MNFENGFIYHIYNQGNNGQPIFFNRENKLYFLKKIKEYISPHCKILAWCLMTNHFHLMVYITNVELVEKEKTKTLNNSIGILLRSYTRAINKQEKRTGSLFKSHTKAECVNCKSQNTLSFIDAGIEYGLTRSIPEKEYPQVCFDYIHQNPVKAKIVTKAESYEFSSAIDYAGLRKGTLIDKELAKEYININLII